MNIITANLDGVLIIEPKVFNDDRGFFLESYHKLRYQQTGIAVNFVQDNHSRSVKNVLRGLHYQLHHTQGKLVSVTRGAVFDVAVDIRPNSPTFAKWVGVILDDKQHKQLYIPPGFAHGFCVLSDEVDFVYKCTDYYHPQFERGIRFDDPLINIKWPIEKPILSAKDSSYDILQNISVDHLPDMPK